MTATEVRRLVRSKAGVLLDVSLGGSPQPNALTFADLCHDPREIPWPLPSGSVHTAVVTHICEYLDPSQVFPWFDELHRVMRPGGICYLSGPYGGDESLGWLSDPQHRTRVVEATFAWLDPRTPIYPLHPSVARPLPRPWQVVTMARVPGTMGTISYNCTMRAEEVDHQNGSKRR